MASSGHQAAVFDLFVIGRGPAARMGHMYAYRIQGFLAFGRMFAANQKARAAPSHCVGSELRDVAWLGGGRRGALFSVCFPCVALALLHEPHLGELVCLCRPRSPCAVVHAELVIVSSDVAGHWRSSPFRVMHQLPTSTSLCFSAIRTLSARDLALGVWRPHMWI